MADIDLSKYDIPVPIIGSGNHDLAVLHFNPVTAEVYAILRDGYRMDKKMDGFGKPVEDTEDFIIRVGKRSQFKLKIKENEFKAKQEERLKAFDLDEAERIAAEKQADSRIDAAWDNPPRKGRKRRPKIAPQVKTAQPGQPSGHAEQLGETDAEEDDSNSKFARFEGTY